MRSSNVGYPHEERIGPEKRPVVTDLALRHISLAHLPHSTDH